LISRSFFVNSRKSFEVNNLIYHIRFPLPTAILVGLADCDSRAETLALNRKRFQVMGSKYHKEVAVIAQLINIKT
jgi:hypothetical protein